MLYYQGSWALRKKERVFLYVVIFTLISSYNILYILLFIFKFYQIIICISFFFDSSFTIFYTTARIDIYIFSKGKGKLQINAYDVVSQIRERTHEDEERGHGEADQRRGFRIRDR